jgi:hypothetical protein
LDSLRLYVRRPLKQASAIRRMVKQKPVGPSSATLAKPPGFHGKTKPPEARAEIATVVDFPLGGGVSSPVSCGC